MPRGSSSGSRPSSSGSHSSGRSSSRSSSPNFHVVSRPNNSPMRSSHNRNSSKYGKGRNRNRKNYWRNRNRNYGGRYNYYDGYGSYGGYSWNGYPYWYWWLYNFPDNYYYDYPYYYYFDPMTNDVINANYAPNNYTLLPNEYIVEPPYQNQYQNQSQFESFNDYNNSSQVLSQNPDDQLNIGTNQNNPNVNLLNPSASVEQENKQRENVFYVLLLLWAIYIGVLFYYYGKYGSQIRTFIDIILFVAIILVILTLKYFRLL